MTSARFLNLLLFFFLNVSLILLLLPSCHPLNQWNIDFQLIFTLKRVLNEEWNAIKLHRDKHLSKSPHTWHLLKVYSEYITPDCGSFQMNVHVKWEESGWYKWLVLRTSCVMYVCVNEVLCVVPVNGFTSCS